MARAEHRITWFELGYFSPDGFDLAGYINAYSLVPWLEQSEQQASNVPVNRIEGSRADFDQNFMVFGDRLFNVRDLENVRRPVSAIDGGFHVRMDAPAALVCPFSVEH